MYTSKTGLLKMDLSAFAYQESVLHIYNEQLFELQCTNVSRKKSQAFLILRHVFVLTLSVLKHISF